jgi:hypothetical protein
MTPDEAYDRALEAAVRRALEIDPSLDGERTADLLCEAFAAFQDAFWQPIATAPRDGTVIDLWFAGDAWNCRMPGFVWRPGMNFWHNETTHQSYNDGPGITHWRPLPAGPGGGA